MIHFEEEMNASRWLAYFDLLGIRALLSSGKELDVFVAYKNAVQEIRRPWARELRHAWLSDTFLIWGEDDSAESFSRLERFARIFAFMLLRVRIPLRGAISSNRFYADVANGIFFGGALVEAYEYGEGQDWIGLLLCPSAIDRLTSLNVSADERLYRFCAVPWKRRPGTAPDQLAACVIGNWITVGGRNPCLESLGQMMATDDRPDVKTKYARTIEFLTKHQQAWG